MNEEKYPKIIEIRIKESFVSTSCPEAVTKPVSKNKNTKQDDHNMIKIVGNKSI